MKRILSTILLSALILSACNPISPSPTPDSKNTEITFPGNQTPCPVIDSSGGSTSISFTAPQEWKLDVSSDATDWCSASPTSGGKGSATVTITTKENTTYEDRQATITITIEKDKKQIKIVQGGQGALIIECENPVKMSVLGGTFPVKVKYNLDFDISTSADWIHQQEQSTKALQNKDLIFTVDANNSGQTRNGTVTFTSKDGSISEDVLVEQGHELNITEGDEIDLGLSVKWARTNIGATNPEDRGDLFAWGEIATRKAGEKFYINNYTMNPYYKPSTGDTRSHLSDDNDAATAILGNKWRMPTQDEVSELLSLTLSVPYKYENNNGLLVIANNGNTLFVPASGYELGYALPDNINDVICFWTNEIAESDEEQAYNLNSHIRNSTVPYLPFLNGAKMMMERCAGLPVRAVRRADITFSELQAETSETSAKLTTSLNLDGVDPSKILKAGYLYSETGVFTSPSSVDTLFCTPTNNAIVYNWEELSSSSTYRVRPFLIVEKEGNYTGAVQSFTTKDEPLPGQWVDLGLSVLWASWNVGATKPGEYGDVFTWGDVEPKDINKSYNDYNYKYYISKKYLEYWEDGTSRRYFYYYRFTKYDTSDEKYILDPEDDAAITHWGDGARTPSKAEMEELVDNCEFKEIIKYGREGILVTSKVNGNSIFLCSRYAELDKLTIKLWTSEIGVEQRDIYYNRGSSTKDETLYDYSRAYYLNPTWNNPIVRLDRYDTHAVRAVKDK